MKFVSNSSDNFLFFSFTRTIANTIKFIRSRNLAGVVAFSIEMDDFKGDCPFNSTDTFIDFGTNETERIAVRSSNDLPFLKTINEAFLVTVPDEQKRLVKYKIGNKGNLIYDFVVFVVL